MSDFWMGFASGGVVTLVAIWLLRGVTLKVLPVLFDLVERPGKRW